MFSSPLSRNHHFPAGEGDRVTWLEVFCSHDQHSLKTSALSNWFQILEEGNNIHEKTKNLPSQRPVCP